MRQLLIAGLISLAGCGFTDTGDFIRKTASQAGAQAFDEGLVNAEWFICQAASIGAIKRRYGQSAEAAAAYDALCARSGSENIVTPQTEPDAG